jgi:hypothetical protein
MRTRMVAALLVAPLVGLVLSAPAAQADPDPRLSITKVELNKASVAVSSLNTVPVTLTVTGGFDSADPQDKDLSLHAYLKRTAGTGTEKILVSMELLRKTGTTQSGTWQGIVNVPSTASGTLEVSGVMTGEYFAGSGDMTTPTPVPADSPKLTVVGTNQPKITSRVIPNPLPFGQGYSIRWSVINGQTGQPYGTKLKVWLANDNGCVESFGGPVYLTDTQGYVTKSYPASFAEFGNCLLLPGYPVPIGGANTVPDRPGIVSAVPAKTSAPVGAVVLVNGTVAGAPSSCPVDLQRLYGATAWRNVGTAKVRQASGKFVLYAQPAYKGNIPYRVSFPACYNYRAGLSRTFTSRGT